MNKLARLSADEHTVEPGRGRAKRAPRLRNRYYAFLSYSHRDEELAEWLHSELEKFRVPNSIAGRLTANGVVPRRLTPIFRDQQDLSAAGDLSDEIEAALAASQFLIVLCSPAAAKSRWTNAEIESFKRARPEGCLLAAVASGEPFASEVSGRETEECFPPALRYKYDRRGHRTSKRAEPLAADLRGSPEDRRTGFLKLVAGMLGVGLDELVQRETTRRHRHLAWLAAASLAGMAVTTTLAVTAFQARNEAREQRREAEGLVAFMVGDLKDKLEPIGRLDALDGVGSRVLNYYSKQDTSDLSDAALLQRSQALSLTAQVSFLRGDLGRAERLYRQALTGTAEAIRRNPDDPARLFEHEQNVFWTGELARRRGQLPSAEAAFREYRDLASRMVALQPDNLKWRVELQSADANLGIVLLRQRRFGEASRQFGSSLSAIGAITAVDPSKGDYQILLTDALGWLAQSRWSEGFLQEGAKLRQRQLDLIARLAPNGVVDVDLQQKRIQARRGLGYLLAQSGDRAGGASQMEAATQEADMLLAAEPRNTLWTETAAAARLSSAELLLGEGKQAEAFSRTETACSMISGLIAKDSTIASWRALLRTCLLQRSRNALSANDPGRALLSAQRALGVARTTVTEDQISDRFAIARAQRLIGDSLNAKGDKTSARQAWSAALSLLPNNVPYKPIELDEQAALLFRLDRTATAQPIAAKLSAMNYHSIS